jgi:hypothetical protein
VHDPEEWADEVQYVVAQCDGTEADAEVSLSYKIDWNGPTLWPAWEKWFKDGAK